MILNGDIKDDVDDGGGEGDNNSCESANGSKIHRNRDRQHRGSGWVNLLVAQEGPEPSRVGVVA